MTEGTEDTLAAGDATIRANDTAESIPEAAPRIRPSRPVLPRPDYPELLVVDPEHYIVAHEIARGGMGRILAARDRRLGRDVAIKEILASTEIAARRFEREARITAQLQHPSIVSVHEAGVWPSGEAFYAMRLVQGRSFDEVIAAATTFDERLASLPTVLAVADAMAYAHGQQVIHRDLKPRNVVVGEFGETVVIDWGLAKQLAVVDPVEPHTPAPQTTAQPGETTVGDVLGTPAYMPPEQAAGAAVDERADVYAIGAILYHLLAGRPPFVAQSHAELIAAVYSESPQRLLELAPTAATELIAIVERAMARDPESRYPTARALAEDLRRFQTGQLVGAHRYTLAQLMRRWLARHRTALVAIGVAALVVIAIGVVALRRVFAAEREADDQRVLAVANQQHAEELMQFMLDDLHPKLAGVGKLDLLEDVARRAARYYDARGDTGSDEDTLLSAKARIAIADVLVARGDLPGATTELAKSALLVDALVARRPDVVAYRVVAITVATRTGAVYKSQGDLAAALASFRQALAAAEQLAETYPTNPAVGHTLFECHTRVASALSDRGDVGGAVVEYRAALASAASSSDLLDAHSQLGKALWDNDALDGAIAEYRIALAIGEREAARDPKDVTWQAGAASSRTALGRILLHQHKPEAALVELRTSFAVFDRLVTIDPSNTVRLVGRAAAAELVGVALLELHDLASALVEFRGVHAMWLELTAKDPSNTDWLRQLSVASNKIGDVQLASHDPAAALVSYRAALAVREQLFARDPSKDKWRRDLFYSHIKLAGTYGTSGKLVDRIAHLRRALAIANESVARNPTNPSAQDDLMNTHVRLGEALVAAHDREGARAEYQAALAIAKASSPIAGKVDGWHNMAVELEARLAKL
ncbi:MAG: serine/threonine-protein kinase [Kofleriaceae bacterium]